MARQARINYPDAWYHVMNRGGARRSIFVSSEDRVMFLQALAEAVERYGIEVHAFCLMGNHYHLLVRAPMANLSEFMRHVDGVYTLRVNRRHGSDGPLFRGRFTGKVIDTDAYLTTAARYVHRNPSELPGIGALASYRWSSYPVYLANRRRPEWLTTSVLLALHGGAAGLRSFTERRDDARDIRLARLLGHHGAGAPPVVGEPAFLESLGDLAGQLESAESASVSLDVIDAVVASAFAIDVDELRRATRGLRCVERLHAIALARQLTSTPVGEIGRHYSLASTSGVRFAVRQLEEMSQRDPAVAGRHAVLTAAIDRLRSSGRFAA